LNILSDILNQFHEGHTTIDFPDEIKEGNYLGNIAISCFYSENSFYVNGFGDEYKDQLQLGDKVVAINGMETNTYFDKCVYPKNNLPYQSAKNYLANRRLFVGNVDDSLHIKLQNKKGKINLLTAKRSPLRIKHNFVHKVPDMYTDSLFEYRELDDFSYVRIGGFLNNTTSIEFAKIIDELRPSKGIVFDLRGNPGGNSQFAQSIVQYFSAEKKIKYWGGFNKMNKSNYRAYSMYKRSETDTSLQMKKYYDYYSSYATYSHLEGGYQYEYTNTSKGGLKDIPVVVLVNSRTASSGESFVVLLKQVIEIKVIGEPTFGSITTPLIIPLPGGGSAWIGTTIAVDEKGEIYKYIAPDIIIDPKVKDVLNGKDKALERAIFELGN